MAEMAMGFIIRSSYISGHLERMCVWIGGTERAFHIYCPPRSMHVGEGPGKITLEASRQENSCIYFYGIFCRQIWPSCKSGFFVAHQCETTKCKPAVAQSRVGP